MSESKNKNTKPSKVKRFLGIFAWIICALSGFMFVRASNHVDTLVWLTPNKVPGAVSAGDGWYVRSGWGDLQIGSENWAIISNPPLPLIESYPIWTAAMPPGMSLSTGEEMPGEPLLIGHGFWTSVYADYQPEYSNQVRLVRIGWWLIFTLLFILSLPFSVIFVRHWREARRRA
jgi:hypothetical protein